MGDDNAKVSEQLKLEEQVTEQRTKRSESKTPAPKAETPTTKKKAK